MKWKTVLHQNTDIFLITWQINLSPFYSYFVLPQPKLHLPQCWGSPHVCSQWGADHWTTSSADASYTPSTAASAPAQPHISGLLCLSPGNGGGKLSGGRKDGGTGPGNSTASRHGVLPELPSPLPGKFWWKIRSSIAWHYDLIIIPIFNFTSARSQIGLSNNPPIKEPQSLRCIAPLIWTRLPARRALALLTSSPSQALRSLS